MFRFNYIGMLVAIGALLGFSMLMAPGCRAPKTVVEEKVVTNDSLVDRVVETIRYVPHTVPGDTVTIVYQLPCDPVTNKPKDQSFNVAGKRSNVKVDVKDGVITATAICNELRDSLAVKDKLIAQLSKSKQQQVKTDTKYVTKTVTPWWAPYTLCISIAVVLLAAFRFYRCIAKGIDPLKAFLNLFIK